jgi:hypothetical protein
LENTGYGSFRKRKRAVALQRPDAQPLKKNDTKNEKCGMDKIENDAVTAERVWSR